MLVGVYVGVGVCVGAGVCVRTCVSVGMHGCVLYVCMCWCRCVRRTLRMYVGVNM